MWILSRRSPEIPHTFLQANTGGCTKQALGFKENHTTIQDAGFEVYGLSFDKPKSQTSWKTKYNLPYHLLTDEGGEVGGADARSLV